MSAATGLHAGDVILLFDGTIRPAKHKRFICVVAAEGWFLRINSERYFRPHLAVKASENPGWLDHDSFVELRGIVEYDLDAIQEAFSRRDARNLGRLLPETASALIEAVLQAPTFTQAEAARIEAALRTEYP